MKKSKLLAKATAGILSLTITAGSYVPCLPGFSVFSEISVSATSSTDYLAEQAQKIIFTNEGSYTSVAKKDGSALSIGKLQWNATRALNLLKTIVNANKKNAESILGTKLYNEILSSKDWSSRTLNDSEASVIKKLLGTDESKKAQDDLAFSNVKGYIKSGLNLGLTDDAVLIYYADLRNQRPVSANNIAKNAKNEAGSYSAVTLDLIHKYALKDSSIGKYTSRRKRTYESCKPYAKAAVNVKLCRNFDSNDTYSVTETFTEGVSNQKFGYKDGKGRYDYMNDGSVGFGKWSRDGYELLGWSEDRNATNARYETYSKVIDSWIKKNSPGVTLYAVWKEKKTEPSAEPVSSPSVSPSPSAAPSESPSPSASSVPSEATSPSAEPSVPASVEPASAQVNIRPDELNPGDTNSDGVIDLTDLSNVSLYLVGDNEMTENQLKEADTNADGIINLSDLANLRRFLSKLQSHAYTEKWVAADSIPEGAEVTGEKWTYDTTAEETMVSDSSSAAEGWTLTGSSWKEVSSGSAVYAEFPDGFDSSSSLCSKYSGKSVKASETENTKREITGTSVKTYVYWHWNYRLDEKCSLANRYISDVRDSKYSHFSAFEMNTNLTESPSGENDVFKYDTKVSDDVSWWWYKIPVYEQKYTEYVKEYTFSVQTVKESCLETDADPSGTDNVSNVQKWVRVKAAD